LRINSAFLGATTRPHEVEAEMDTRKRAASILSLVLYFLAFNAHAAPQKAPETRAVKAGEFLVDPPTLINLGFEWAISGDDNRNAKVDVS